MDINEKKKRSRNFSEEEKMLCLSLVKKYSNIIENKKTDSVSWRQKDEAWQEITKQFNAQCPATVNRTKENLKNFFENRKRETRKLAAQERSSMYETGGGPPTSKINDPLFDLTMSIMNPKSVTGLVNCFDDDVIEEGETIEIRVLDDIQQITEQYEDTQQEKENQEIHNQNKNPESVLPKKAWVSRRRPLPPSQSCNLAEKYEALANIKIEVAKLQLEILKHDALHQEKKQKLETVELESRRQYLETERQLKLEQLKEEHDLKRKSLLWEIDLKKTQIQVLRE